MLNLMCLLIVHHPVDQPQGKDTVSSSSAFLSFFPLSTSLAFSQGSGPDPSLSSKQDGRRDESGLQNCGSSWGLSARGGSPQKSPEQIQTACKQRQSMTVQNSICLLVAGSPSLPPGAERLLPNALVTAFKRLRAGWCKHRDAGPPLPPFHLAPCWKLVPQNVMSLIHLYRCTRRVCAAAGGALRCGEGDLREARVRGRDGAARRR